VGRFVEPNNRRTHGEQGNILEIRTVKLNRRGEGGWVQEEQ